MICSSSADKIWLSIFCLFIFVDTTLLNPNNWIHIVGIIATKATTPKASVNTFASPFKVKHTPTANGRIKLDVNGPDATPPESNAMDVYILGTKNESAKDIIYPGNI